MDNLYDQLREWMHNASPNGFRETEKGEAVELLRTLFTEEDAQLALQLDLELQSLKEIAQNAGMNPDKAEEVLDRLYLQGLIRRRYDAAGKLYAALSFFPGVVENLLWIRRNDKRLKDLVMQILKTNGILSINDHISLSRTVPISEAIPDKTATASYQDVVEMVKVAPGPIVVFPCLCRSLKKEHCTAPMEVCMAFGDHGQFYLDAGGSPGRQIDVEEALQILKTAAEAGLIHQFVNFTDEDLSWLCNCCSCCCVNLGAGNKLFPDGKMKTVDSSVYIASLNIDQCNGCGACIDKCPVHALAIIDHVAVSKQERCIGCGQCVIRCPLGAISLKERAADKIPKAPKTLRELVERQQKAQAAKNN